MKISIVTVCYNSIETIEKTVQSVVKQTHDDIEYIVIDGESSDGTKECVQSYAQKYNFIKVLSESDNGIYNAMNKSISLLSGEYTYFLNSGDCFKKNNIVERINKFLENKTIDLLYGNIEYDFIDRKEIRNYYKKRQLNKIWIILGITISHQAVFTKTALLKQRGFDESFKIWADQDFFSYWIKHKCVIQRCPIVICEFDAFGFSSGGDKKSISREECDRIVKRYFIKGYYLIRPFKQLVRCLDK